jgi:hypothetical protein
MSCTRDKIDSCDTSAEVRRAITGRPALTVNAANSNLPALKVLRLPHRADRSDVGGDGKRLFGICAALWSAESMLAASISSVMLPEQMVAMSLLAASEAVYENSPPLP